MFLRETGFIDITIEPKAGSHELIKDWSKVDKLEEPIVSANIEATKPNYSRID